MIALALIDANSQVIEAVLDRTLFYLVVNWNESAQNWTLGIRDAAYRTLIAGISMVPNYPLLAQVRYPRTPLGELLVLSPRDRDGPIGRDGFQRAYELVYMTQADIDELGLWGGRVYAV